MASRRAREQIIGGYLAGLVMVALVTELARNPDSASAVHTIGASLGCHIRMSSGRGTLADHLRVCAWRAEDLTRVLEAM